MSRRALLAAGLVALLVGFLAGRSSVPDVPHRVLSGRGHAELAREALATPAGLERALALTSLLASLEPADHPAVADVFETWGYPPATTAEIELVFGAWASADPEPAFETALRWANEYRNPVPAQEVLRTWASRDPVAALAALESPDGGRPALRSTLAPAMASGWAQHGVSTALTNYLLTLPEGRGLERVVREIVQALSQRGGLEAAIGWADTLPYGEKREKAFKKIAFRKVALSFGASQSEEVAHWLEAYQEDRLGATAIHVLGRTWAGVDPAATLGWAQTLSDRTSREWSVREAFEVWVGKDRASAVDWLETASTEDQTGALDAAVSHYAKMLARDSDEHGDLWLAWADRITTPRLRTNTLIAGGINWHRVDPEAAGVWLANSELSEEDRAEVVKSGSGRRARQGKRTRKDDAP